MDVVALHEWFVAAGREAGFKLGRKRANGVRPIDVPSLQRLWGVYRESLQQPLDDDCGALVVIEFHGNARQRTCSVEMARRSGVETYITGVSLQLTAPWPSKKTPPPRVVLDQQNHHRSEGDAWLLPLDPLLDELEGSDTFRAVLEQQTSWSGHLGVGDYGD